ncbi:MAG: FG-GAP-like repeat-containing protein [Verrucomicrobia bacterium]|nr:FG-GAP-like repeat-containing protein [Verrucomicrobiota bacterium]
MNRRTAILLVVLLVVGSIALWRRGPALTPDGRQLEAQADAAARRFMALREAEELADREVWHPTQLAVRIEQELVLGVERAMGARSLDAGVLPNLAARISAPTGYSLRWMQVRLMRVRPNPQTKGLTAGFLADLESEVVLEGPTDAKSSRAIWTARFLAESDWSDGETPRLRNYRLSQPPTVQSGVPVFEPWADLLIPTNGVGLFTDPLLKETTEQGVQLHLAGAGVTAVRVGEGWRWETGDMGPPDRVKAIVRADLDGDGTTEVVVADASGVQVRGRDGWRQAWVAPAKLRHPQSITAGDIDGDGDLDLWVTQYRLPFVNGQFPTPYYDANDGFPSYLLRNDGTQWLDITEVSGLAPKRYRRTYSASWLDFDGDGDLDLVNVSDFAGLDFYRNDGRGHFTDMTSGLGLTRHAFGMAHVVWDANHDALPDLLMVGMDSPVASQLDALGLGRSEFPGHTVHRGAMTYGNRLFVGSRSRGMELSPLSEDLRRAGWAWGAAVLDWNNDGRDDIHLVNGHETFESRSDFERQFWQHDVYVGGSTPDPAAQLYFMQANERRRAARQSYGGWQANRLFTQTVRDSFVENAWILGVAVTEDCRNVVAGDFDEDGRMDLALTTYEQWPVTRQRLLIFRNRSVNDGHWIGYRLNAPAPGSHLEVTTREGIRRHWWVNGDGYRSQSDTEAHFGLGQGTEVLKAEWVRLGGARQELPRTLDRWHRIGLRP